MKIIQSKINVVVLTIVVAICIVFGVVSSFLIGTGFAKCDVWLIQHNVSEDSSTISIKVAVASSIGYTRDYSVKQVGDNKYITFYSCFGGLNSNKGAKNEFKVEVDPACEEIYFYGGGEYKLALQKNPVTNEWENPNAPTTIIMEDKE